MSAIREPGGEAAIVERFTQIGAGGADASDLSTRSDIHDAVVGFYREVVFDELLGPVFEEVAEVDWARHIPLLIDYWCRVLLGHEGYQGAILVAHQHVHDRQAFAAEHFDRWYGLWVTTIETRWSGPHAEKAKRHAAKIASTMARRLLPVAWTPPTQTPGLFVDGSENRG